MSGSPPAPENGHTPPPLSVLDERITAVRDALWAVDPRAFIVEPRVLRRVVKQEWDIPTLALQVPHRKSWICGRNQLIKHVDWDELGLDANCELPPTAILLARPDDKHLESMSLEEFKRQAWRLLFHARLHLAFDELKHAGKLKPSDVRRRIDKLGQVAADEIFAVLKREGFLKQEPTQTEVFIEFAAVFSEFRRFQPHCLTTYFPSIDDFDRVAAVLAEDVDIDALFDATKLEGSAPPTARTSKVIAFDELHEISGWHGEPEHAVPQSSEEAAERSSDRFQFPALNDLAIAELKPAPRPNLRAFSKLIRRADKAFARGNAVAAALLQINAARFASPELVHEAVNGALTDMQRLVQRLRAALGFDESTARCWYESLTRLLLHAAQGFWNADKKLLYDLQKVCVDHEREIYTVDLLGWAFSLGKRPIKRSLPNQREVLMSKHLRSATRRLVAAQLTGEERDRLSGLLHAADESAERQMRVRLRPLATQALTDVGFTPATMPEQVAFKKLVEELLDGVVVRGFITMGDLRDAISRSNLKLVDLSGPIEFFVGDKLLQADRQLYRILDGVYQRGDVYLRWLQRLSAASFGTSVGRFLTRYGAIPYGAAFITIEAVLHLVEKVAGHDSDLVLAIAEMKKSAPRQWAEIFGVCVGLLGTLLLLLIHAAPFRRFVWVILRKTLKLVWRLCVLWPAKFLRLPIVKKFLKSSPIVAIRKFVITPFIPTVVLCDLIPRMAEWPSQPAPYWLIVWAAFSVMLNSRVGRDVEELSAEWLHRTWHRVRVHIFVALFDLVMESFKKLLEAFERVLYAVDEWLRFKSGETSFSLGLKAVLGIFWSVVTFVLRFCVNLLIEPQINPIKHFPVVTVSHKLILPLGIPGGVLSTLILPLVGDQKYANTIAGTTVFLIPGIFGFLVWELQSNWKLYRANRGDNLKPVLVGSHGETFIRLMKPGFHSGTLPKLFARLRRVDRHREDESHSLARSKYLDQLHHVQISVRHFVERELLQLLDLTSEWQRGELQVSHLCLASNSVRIELTCPALPGEPMSILFEEQSGWLVAGTPQSGWLRQLSEKEQLLVLRALVGFYRLAGVDLVREQIAMTFSASEVPYDIAEAGLLMWPGGSFEEEATYNLHQLPVIRPYPKNIASKYQLPAVNAENLLFVLTPISWTAWAAQWDPSITVKEPLLPERVSWSWTNPPR